MWTLPPPYVIGYQIKSSQSHGTLEKDRREGSRVELDLHSPHSDKEDTTLSDGETTPSAATEEPRGLLKVLLQFPIFEGFRFREYRLLWSCLGFDPRPIDAIIEQSGLTARAVSAMLLLLELRGKVEAHPGGAYSRKKRG